MTYRTTTVLHGHPDDIEKHLNEQANQGRSLVTMTSVCDEISGRVTKYLCIWKADEYSDGTRKFPPYVAMGGPDGTAIRHQGCGEYWRDAGAWMTEARWNVDGELELADPTPDGPDWSNIRPGFPITQKQWKNDNGDYV